MSGTAKQGKTAETGEYKEIKVQVKEYTRKKDGHKFFGYKAIDKKGNLMELSFTKKALDDYKKDHEEPKENFLLIVLATNMNIDRYSNVRPKVWVNAIEEIKPFVQERSEKAEQDIEDTF